MDPLYLALISTAIALAALSISALSLWRTHFAMPKPILNTSRLRLRVYPIKNSGERWYIVSFDLPLSICNPGAQPLLLSAVRLRLSFPQVPIPNNGEVLPVTWEINADDAQKISRNRFEWIDHLRPREWMSTPILPKSTVIQHLIFEARWDLPVVQETTEIELQIKWSGSRDFMLAGHWKIGLRTDTWAELITDGTSFSYFPSEARHTFENITPPDLHKYIASKEPIPKASTSSSYLDFPKQNDNRDSDG